MDILSILPFMVILETDAAKAIGAAIAMAVGGIGPALAIGMLVGKAMEALGRHSDEHDSRRRLRRSHRHLRAPFGAHHRVRHLVSRAPVRNNEERDGAPAWTRQLKPSA